VPRVARGEGGGSGIGGELVGGEGGDGGDSGAAGVVVGAMP
jgi:hypothetical protein